ncbi:MAG: hypothetical protein GY830_06390 [Bacteroidetes bacterium]|nr:hypothetical protein [Bacteroidota bacterium]
MIQIIILLIAINCTALQSNKIEHYEKISSLYNESIEKLKNVDNIDKSTLPPPIKQKNLENIKSSIIKLSQALNKKGILKEESNDNEREAYNLIKSLIKELKTTYSEKALKKKANILNKSFEKASEGLKSQLDDRQIFIKLLDMISNVGDSSSYIKDMLRNKPGLCALQRETTGRTALHEAFYSSLKIKPEINDSDKDDEDNDQAKKNQFSKIKNIIEFILVYKKEKNQLQKAFRSFDKKNKLPINIAAEKNLYHKILKNIKFSDFEYFDDSKVHKLFGIYDNFDKINNPLHSAYSNASDNDVKKLMEINPKLISKLNDKGQNPLHVATIDWNTSADYFSFLLYTKEFPDQTEIHKALNTLAKDEKNKYITPLHNFIKLLTKQTYSQRNVVFDDHPAFKIIHKLNENKGIIKGASTIDGSKKISLEDLKTSLFDTLEQNRLKIEKNNKELYQKVKEYIKNL